jgi:hypothetical protein
MTHRQGDMRLKLSSQPSESDRGRWQFALRRAGGSEVSFPPIVVGIVRRERALDFSRWNFRPGTGSLHWVAIEAAVEVTKLLKPSMERVVSAIQRARRP